MIELFETRSRAATSAGARLRLWRRTLADVIASVWRERPPATRSLPLSMAADARAGWRFLQRAPGLSAAIVLLTALTIGAATGVFSVVNAVLFRPLPYRDPARLVMVWEARPSVGIEHAGRRRSRI
jgi:hypothetical protein